MEESRAVSPLRLSGALRSLLFAAWGVFLAFIGLNPLGMFLFLWVLAVPAWVLGCAGLFYGIRSLLKRDGPRWAAAAGAALNALIVLLPLYPFAMAYYQGTAK